VTDEPRSEPGRATPEGASSEEHAASVAQHDAVTHMDVHMAISDDDHGHAEPRLGPIDWGAWAYALVGAAAGLVVVALFLVAVSR
jgi:hypothetical protein